MNKTLIASAVALLLAGQQAYALSFEDVARFFGKDSPSKKAVQTAPASAPNSSKTSGGAQPAPNPPAAALPPQPAASAPVATVVEAAPVADSLAAAAQTAPTAPNPFTGMPQSRELLQQQLELKKYQRQLLEEELKIHGLNEDIKGLPLKKRAELAAVTGGALPAAQNRAAPAQSVEKQAARPKRKTAAKKSPAQDASASAPAALVASLTSVISVAGQNTAVLDFSGNVLVASAGTPTPIGVVQSVSETSVTFASGQVLRVHPASLARVAVSDRQPAAAAAAAAVGAKTGTAASTADAPPAAGSAASKAFPPLPPIPGLSMPTSPPSTHAAAVANGAGYPGTADAFNVFQKISQQAGSAGR